VPNARVLYTDIDGTLVGPLGNFFWDDDRRWTLAAADALVRAHRAGLEIVALSGRRPQELTELGRLLGLSSWIAELGGVRVYERGMHVVHDTGGYAGDDALIDVLRDAMRDLLSEHVGRLAEHAPWNEGRHVSVMVRGVIDLDAADRWLKDRGMEWAHFVENGVIERRYDDLPGVDEVHVYHLTPRGLSKRDAVLADQEFRGLDAAACAVIGDAASDLACADVVAHCFVVRNAVEKDRSLADAVRLVPNAVVTARGHGEGFADAVTALLD